MILRMIVYNGGIITNKDSSGMICLSNNKGIISIITPGFPFWVALLLDVYALLSLVTT